MAPPTPPEIDGQGLSDGLHELLQHNTRGQPSQESYSFDNGSYIPGQHAPFTTPEPEQGGWYMDQFGNKNYLYHDQTNLGGDVQFDGYGQPAFNHPYHGHPPPQQHHYPNPAYYSVSPPPTNSDQSTPSRRMPRQNRSTAEVESRHSSPKPRRRAARNGKVKTLSGPLSELTKDMVDIPIKDTEAHVSRSIEERRAEAERDRFVKRPSNSFILYRSAFAERARAFQKSANHQVVSSLAGESWAMEPPEIREQYDNWAKRERDAHAAAFPEYKFQPQQNKVPGRKRKGRDDDSEDEESDLDSDYAYNPRTSARPVKSKKGKNAYRESSNTPSGASLDDFDAFGMDPPGFYQPSSYRMLNPGKPLPLNQLRSSQYYQTTSHPSQSFAGATYADDLFSKPDDASLAYHQPGAPVIGIPGAYHHELQGDDDGQSMLNQVDPMLANYDNGHPSLSLGNGHAMQGQDVPPVLPSAGFQPGQFSPRLNDFESEHGDLNDFGSEGWWKINKDR
ncbi:hypothetical protein ACLMJK_004096 [Lecanora helva]